LIGTDTLKSCNGESPHTASGLADHEGELWPIADAAVGNRLVFVDVVPRLSFGKVARNHG
jgi:hypothetical protein